MLRIMIKFMISSDGESPGQLVERLRNIGGIPLAGEYDIEIPLGDSDRLFPKLEEIHAALKGSGVHYTLYTGGEEPDLKQDAVSTMLPKAGGDQKLLELRKNAYRQKLSRWREMGIDTSHLEELLENDIDKFREESKNFLKEHLDKHKMVEDVDRSLKKIDEEVFRHVDPEGVPLELICKECNLSENDAILSLGRLISAGKVLCVVRDGKEFYAISPSHKVDETTTEACHPATTTTEAENRVLSSLRTKGSSAKQIVQDTKLPEEQALNAISDLVSKGLLKSAKRGKGTTIYVKAAPQQ